MPISFLAVGREVGYYLDDSDADLTAQYLLVVDAANFCFWPDGELEYERTAARGALAQGEALLEPRHRVLVPLDEFRSADLDPPPGGVDTAGAGGFERVPSTDTPQLECDQRYFLDAAVHHSNARGPEVAAHAVGPVGGLEPVRTGP